MTTHFFYRPSKNSANGCDLAGASICPSTVFNGGQIDAVVKNEITQQNIEKKN